MIIIDQSDYISLTTSSSVVMDIQESSVIMTTSGGISGIVGLTYTTSSATTITVANGPGSGSQKQLKVLTIANTDTLNPCTVLLQYNYSSSAYNLIPSIVLQAGETLVYTGDGYRHFDAGGIDITYGLITGGTVFSLYTTNGITGGPIVTTGTIGLDSIAAYSVLANTSSGSASPYQALAYTAANTASTLVLRDGSGNFAATNITATKFITSGGTSSDFVKGDGSLDSNTYLTTSSASSTYVPYSGATGTVDLNGQSLTNIATPLGSTDAVTKAYVDAQIAGLSPKPTAVVGTTTTLPSYTYLSGVITMSSTGVVAIDGHNLALGDIVLVKNETSTNQPYNGLYNVTTAGAIGVACVLTRNSEMNSGTEFSGSLILTEDGTVNAGILWYCTTNGTVTVGITNITFSPLSITVVAGTGISVSGNTVSISSSWAGQSAITTLGTIATGVWQGSPITNSYLQYDTVTVNGTTIALGGSGTCTAAAGTLTGTTLNSSVVTSSLTSVGTIASGVWNGTAITNTYLANSSLTVNGTSISLGGSGTVTAAAGTLTGTTLNSTVVTSSLTSVGTIATGVWNGTAIATGYIANNAVTYAKMQQASTVTLLGNPTGGTANVQEITLGSGLAFSGSTLTASGSGGTVTSVSGTANQIASTGGATPVLSLVSSAILPGSPTVATPGTSAGSVTSIDGTQTLTNKRWTARIGSTTSSATPTINTDNYDIYKLTAQAAAITSFTTNLTGTPVDGDVLEIQITDNGTARAITWGTSFAASSVALPTTTVISTTLTVIFQYYATSSYGNNKWICAGTW